MDQARHKRIHDLHSWLGVVCGLFVFIVSLSGVFSLFGDELRTWEDERLRIAVAPDPAPVMPMFSAFADEMAAAGRVLTLSLKLPTAAEPVYAGNAVVRHDDGTVRVIDRLWHPNTGARISLREKGLVHWVVDFHRNLMLDRTLGRIVVGMSGAILLLLILSGVVIHRKILREMHTWRLYRSVRLRWQDSHKAMAVWSLPFHVMFAFTGAWLGLVVIFVPLVAAIAFQGNPGAIFAAVSGEGAPPAGVSAPMFSIDEAAKRVEARVGRAPVVVTVTHWRDAGAVYTFRYREDEALISHGLAKVGGADGDIRAVYLVSKPGFLPRVLPAVTTLHYGQYGGLWVKFLYVLLGLALCLVTATGLMIWLERRLHGDRPRPLHRVLSRVTVGVCAGMGFATFAIFHVDRQLPADFAGRLAVVGSVYFGTWIAAALYALARRNEYRTCRDLLAATAVLAAALPVSNMAATGDGIAALLHEGHVYAAGVDIAGLAVGVTLMAAALRIPAGRPEARP